MKVSTDLVVQMILSIGCFQTVVLLPQPSEKIVTRTLTDTVKAAQVAKATIGDLYFGVLDQPPARGPGAMVIPAEASEGHVQLGAVTLSRTTIDAQPQQFKNFVITDELMKKSLNWIHGRLY